MTDDQAHVSSDDLVLLFYGDTTSEEQARLAGHLDECATCRAERNEIAAVLQLAGTWRSPEPEPGFEDATWARLRPQLRMHRRWSLRHVMTVASWAAAVGAVAVGTHILLRPAPVRVTPPVASVAAPAPQGVQGRVLLTAVDLYLARTEMLFVEMLNAPDVTPDALTYARTAADDLVSSGRLYRETALETGEDSVAAVLDDLETVLVEVARGDAAEALDFMALRDRIEDDGLLFKVRAVTHDIRNRQSRTTTGEGAL
jgi:hypothetical protein